VVLLEGVRIVTYLAELNGLELWGTYVGNAYLELYTKEKVAFIAGPEFGQYTRHTMIIQKVRYGLKSSGKCWHDRQNDVLSSLGFFLSKVDDNIWMWRPLRIPVYVDDLLI
jgi:hypothetical protein